MTAGSRGAQRGTAREREGAFEHAVIAAEVRYSLVANTNPCAGRHTFTDRGPPPGMQTVHENTVRFEETDAQGVVFYGNYVTFQDEAVTAYLEAIGYPYEKLRDADWDVHVVHVDLDYRAPAEFRDRLSNAVRVDAVRESSIEFDYECRDKADEVVAEGGLVHVAVDESGEPTRVPEECREAVVDFQAEPPAPV